VTIPKRPDSSPAPRRGQPGASPGGAAALGEAHAILTRYVVFPSAAAADAVTLYAAATHAMPALEFAARLVIKSPEKRCGKSRLLDVLGQLVARPLTTSDISAAALVRSIGPDAPPTILLDEADATFGRALKGDEKAEHLRGILNAGFTRDRPYKRWDILTRDVQDCPTFAMAVLAGIGSMPDTVEDRAVIVAMRRKAGAERVAKYRIRRDKPAVTAVGDRLAGWVTANAEAIGAAVPDMPAGLNDRAEDVWESLLAVADLAGGDWSARARAAARKLSAEADQAEGEGSLNLRLLADARETFSQAAAPFLRSGELVARLRKLEDAPWNDIELTAERLSARLRHYGIRPGHNPARTVRGYRLEDFYDAFTRYLPQYPRPIPSDPVPKPLTRENLRTGWTRRTGQPVRQKQPVQANPQVRAGMDGIGRDRTTPLATAGRRAASARRAVLSRWRSRPGGPARRRRRTAPPRPSRRPVTARPSPGRARSTGPSGGRTRDAPTAAR
jgi:Protein of unknown function (DUF3631)